MVDLALFLQLAMACAPNVAPETLAAVARTESRFDELAVFNNTTRKSHAPATKAEAIALATDAITVQRHSVDLGLMQVNSANLPRLGLSIADAFDPCHSLGAANRILLEGYSEPADGGDQQPALHRALSRYNTGHPARGIANGYVAKVQASAEQVVPAIRLRGEAPDAAPRPVAPQPATSLPPFPPPSWDVYGQARSSRSGGTIVFGGQRPPGAPAASPSPPTGPVQLRASSSQQASNDPR